MNATTDPRREGTRPFTRPVKPDPRISQALRLLMLTYEAVTDACEEGYAPDFSAVGAPLVGAIRLLRRAAR